MSADLIFSLRFTFIGILIVFSALTLIAASIHYISRLEKYTAGRSKTSTDQPPAQKSTIDNITLVLISAAVATMILGRFHIRRIRRLLPGSKVRSPWSAQGLAILHGSHVLRKQ